MILAADLGTSSLKAGLITPEGHLFSRHRVSYQRAFGAETDDFDPRRWADAFVEALGALEPARVSAVALSGNGPTLVPVDAKGNPTAPADLWLLRRSVHIEGSDSYYLPKAAWLRDHAKKGWQETVRLLSCPEYLHYRLTGREIMTLPHEEFRRYIWEEKDFSVYGLDPSLFPELVPMATVAGAVTAAASARTGLAEGTPVIAVGSDFMAALLGSGAVAPGRVCDRAGTSEGINYCAEAPSGDPRLRDLPHVIPPFWNAAAILSSTGALFEWYRRITGQENYTYEDTLSAIARTPAAASSPLFFPGPRDGGLWEFSDGGFLRLDPRHGRGEMGRAVMEAIGFAVRRGIEILENAELPVNEMRITGGQARGRFWNRMKADITGRRLLIPEIEDAELAGGVCAAAVALGRYDTLAEASEALVTIKQVYDPDPEAVKIYDDAYARYRESAEAYKRLFPGEEETRAD